MLVAEHKEEKCEAHPGDFGIGRSGTGGEKPIVAYMKSCEKEREEGAYEKVKSVCATKRACSG